MTTPTTVKLHVIDQSATSPKAAGGMYLFAHKIDFMLRQMGTKMQLEFGSDAQQEQVRNRVLTFLHQGAWEVMDGGGEGAADGWEPFPAKAQLELETAYRADQKIVTVVTAAASEGRTNLHTMMFAQTDEQGNEAQKHIRVRPLPNLACQCRQCLCRQLTRCLACAAHGPPGQDSRSAATAAAPSHDPQQH